jgi:hypothetical protein
MNPQDDVPAVPLDHQIARANGVTDDQIEQAKKVLTWQHNDPAAIGWPVTLPLELAMGEQTPKEICQSYDISRERFATLAQLPAFQKAYADAQALLKQDGMTFRVKARMQSELLLETAFALIHAPGTPSNVKADLIKATWKFGGLEPKEEGGNGGNQLNIQINL